MNYFCVVVILFSMGLYKSAAFSTYDFGKTSFLFFCVLVFRVSASLGFNFSFALCFEFSVFSKT